jgi:hypothetical protein
MESSLFPALPPPQNRTLESRRSRVIADTFTEMLNNTAGLFHWFLALKWL